MRCCAMLCHDVMCTALRCYAMQRYAMICNAVLRRPMPCYAMICNGMHHATLCVATPRHAVLYNAVLRYATLRDTATIRHVLLGYAVQCMAMLRHAILCNAVLGCATLCRRPAQVDDPQQSIRSAWPWALLLSNLDSNGHPIFIRDFVLGC